MQLQTGVVRANHVVGKIGHCVQLGAFLAQLVSGANNSQWAHNSARTCENRSLSSPSPLFLFLAQSKLAVRASGLEFMFCFRFRFNNVCTPPLLGTIPTRHAPAPAVAGLPKASPLRACFCRRPIIRSICFVSLSSLSS